MRAETRLRLDGRHDVRMIVPEQQGAMAHDVVDKLVTVDVPFPAARARATYKEKGEFWRMSCVTPSGKMARARSLSRREPGCNST